MQTEIKTFSIFGIILNVPAEFVKYLECSSVFLELCLCLLNITEEC